MTSIRHRATLVERRWRSSKGAGLPACQPAGRPADFRTAASSTAVGRAAAYPLLPARAPLAAVRAAIPARDWTS
jgi:hypothetical protein